MIIQSITVKQAVGQEWADAHNHLDIGEYPGLCRGYNIEFVDPNGEVHYSDMVLTTGPLNTDNLDFSREILAGQHTGRRFTGRAVFRGYYTGDYDQEKDYMKPLGNEEFAIFYDQVMRGEVPG